MKLLTIALGLLTATAFATPTEEEQPVSTEMPPKDCNNEGAFHQCINDAITCWDCPADCKDDCYDDCAAKCDS